jgi:cystathionine beta-lyase family protein involved in aluminum resistance
VKSKKQTISQLNQVQTNVSKSKLESEVKTHSKEIKKVNHNNFHRVLEAFSDCV